MLRFGLHAVTGALTFLVAPSQINAAVEIGSSVAESLIDKGFIEPVHYSSRYGWHCGMRNYGHEHRKSCQRAYGATVTEMELCHVERSVQAAAPLKID